MRDQARYFAIVSGRTRGKLTGYALDYYPNERDALMREEKKYIVGDFESRVEAHAAVKREIQKRLAEHDKRLKERRQARCLVS